MDLLRDMRVFIRVVERGNISLAAHDLGVSQSTLSGRLAQLEGHIGARLLFRNSRSVSPTDVGREFYARSKRTIELAAFADETPAALASHPLRGTLRILAPHVVGDLLLPKILLRLQRINPNLSFEVILEDRVTDAVSLGADIVIHHEKVAATGFVAIHLGSMQQVLVAAPGYIAAHGPLQKPEDLAHHSFIRLKGRFEDEIVPLVSNQGATTAAVRTAWTVGNWRALHTLLVGGAGVGSAELPAVCEALADGSLQRILADHEVPDIPVGLLYPDHALPSEKLRRAVAFLVGELRPMLAPPPSSTCRAVQL